MCCPRGATTSATMDCGVRSIGLSCTNSSAGWRGTQLPPLPPLLHQRRLQPMSGVRPSERATLSILRSGPAGRDPFHAQTPTGVTMSAPVASQQAPFMHGAPRPAAGSPLLVCRSRANRPEASGAAPPPRWPPFPPNRLVSRLLLAAGDHGLSSHAPSKMLPTRFRLDYNSLEDGAVVPFNRVFCRLYATKTLFR